MEFYRQLTLCGCSTEVQSGKNIKILSRVKIWDVKKNNSSEFLLLEDIQEKVTSLDRYVHIAVVFEIEGGRC